jgi:hypothetical protein
MKWEVMFHATVNEVGGDVPSDSHLRRDTSLSEDFTFLFTIPATS